MNGSNEQVVQALRAAMKEAQRLRNQNRSLLAAAAEPIAVVGIGCRYPGGVRSPEDLWRLVDAGVDAVSDLPADRGWDLAGLDDGPDERGNRITLRGGFLDRVADFDPGFFNISPREAVNLDPQQRLLLETSWEAVERARIDLTGLRGRRVGVFVGTNGQDYAHLLLRSLDDANGEIGTGISASALAGRLSYAFGFQGPSLTVDTACSSSLVALHLASHSLRAGESELALAGGVNVMATPGPIVEFSRTDGLAGDGRCKAFSEDADGTGWAEGVGVLVLEKLSDARRNRHPVLAVLRGSAVNSDGTSNGFTAPNGPSQQRVIRQALAAAGVEPSEVDVVEAHGTGTPLGDPIEAESLLSTYGQDRDEPLLLGSIKSNMGHAQAAAGVAGVIKMIGAMAHGVVPKTLHADRPSTRVAWHSGAVELLTERRDWPETGRPRRSAVSSFGISGTNAHVVLEQAPAPAPTGERTAGVPVTVPWVLAGVTGAALRDQVAALLTVPEPDLLDVAYSLATTRAAFEHRLAVVGADVTDLRSGLEAWLETGSSPAVVEGVAGAGRLAMVFSGQGAQRLGMGGELAARFPVFAAAFDEALAELDPAVRACLDSDAARLDETGYAQPALFAFQVALARLLASWGVEPGVVAGHSVGEIAAAHIAGVFSLADAARLVSARARLMQALPAGGAMVAVQASEETVRPLLSGEVAIAAVNGPSSVVLSGTQEQVRDLVKRLGVRSTRLRVSHAFHSPLMDPMLDDFRAAIAGLSFREPRTAVVSSVFGRVAGPGELTTPEYWARQVRETVRFADSVRALERVGAVLEVSPEPVLAPLVAAALPEVPVVPATRGDGGEERALVTALARLHVSGAAVGWQAFFSGSGAELIDLPTYPFQHERFWSEARVTADLSATGVTAAGHPLLAVAVEMAGSGELVLTGSLSPQTRPWLADHVVGGLIFFPGTGFFELARHAGDRVGCGHVEELTLLVPLELPEHGGVRVQIRVGEPDGTGRREVRFFGAVNGALEAPWTLHATGSLSPEVPEPSFEVADWPPAGATVVDLGGVYDRYAAAGLEYGPAFRCLRAVWRRGDELFAEAALPESAAKDAASLGLHPGLLDSVLHAAACTGDGERLLPFEWRGVTLHASGADVLRARLVRTDQATVVLSAADATGAPVISVDSLTLRAPAQAAVAGVPDTAGSLFGVDWVRAEVAAGDQDWAVLSPDRLGLAAALREAGASCAVLDDLGRAEELPPVVAASFTGGDTLDAVHEQSAEALDLLQRWLAEPAAAEALLVVAIGDDDLASAAIRGLVLSAQSEHPGRFLLVEVDTPDGDSLRRVPLLIESGEPRSAVRDGELRLARLTRLASGPGLLPPEGAWRLGIGEPGSIDALGLVPCDREPLTGRQVEVAVRAAGLNFRDVLSTVGMYPGEPGLLGSETAGVVVGTGPEALDFAVGDRVMGMVAGGFAPHVVVDERQLVAVPAGWSWETAGSVPLVFLTAYLALVELAGVRPGDKVLVHAGAGGVGMAAVQLAGHLGAEVFATASPSKHPVLRELGVAPDHIASSRTTEFETEFGQGIDVVLNALSGEFVDASLRLLRPGGTFLEMGKTDLRENVPGVRYLPFDLGGADPDALRRMLTALAGLFADGVLKPLPVRAWDIRRAREAFRFMSHARHVGKLVLTLPVEWDRAGTVLITGGTGGLGAQVARHLVRRGHRHLVLASRRGLDAPGAEELVAELDADVRVVACDVSDPGAVRDLVAAVSPELTAVVHAAGVLDDGVLEALDPERLAVVLRSKVDSAWYLDQATRELDLAGFVLFSSVAGVLGSPGQANYGAANAALAALAANRRAAGHTAVAIAWSGWEQDAGMTAGLGDGVARRSGAFGLPLLPVGRGLELFDAAVAADEALVVPLPVGSTALPAGSVPAPLRGLVRATRRTAGRGETPSRELLAAKLAGLPPSRRARVLTDLVRAEAAVVLGHASVDAIDSGKEFRQLGFDSLTAIELRNRLAGPTGLRLPATLVFDYPTPQRLAEYLLAELVELPAEATPAAPFAVADDPLVLVGMACRFAGGIDTPEALWELLEAGGDVISDFPADRGWETGLDVARGGFLDDVAGFDAEFFGISPREALAMDPQQRVLLEVAWETAERAGIDPASLRGTKTGVFVGHSGQDYSHLILNATVDVQGHAATGLSGSVASGRLAYQWGLVGPAVTVDTACSSSLVALHLAGQALRAGDCDLALVGAVTVMSTPAAFAGFARMGGLAGDGRCKAFADAADGTGWSEGAGVVLLERLSDAVRRGHEVLAVVRGSAVNSDGASNGLTAPNGPSQRQVIGAALRVAGLAAQEIDVVEAHGTGTALGDPIEAQALLATYGQDRDRPLLLGSVKSNLGHAQAAAGVAGLIKMVLALRLGMVPKTLHVDEPSSHVDWTAGSVELLRENTPWPDTGRPRRAGLSSFSFSGTNAHVVLEQAPEPEPGAAPELSPAPEVVPWVVSARSEVALDTQIERLRLLDASAADIGFSLATTRTAFEHRAVLVEGREIARGVVPASGRLAVVCAGQGTQRLGMGKGLHARFPVFAKAFDEVVAELDRHLDRPLVPVMWGEDQALLDRTVYAQPALFALEVASFRLAESLGAHADLVAGHSVGEIAAAHVAEVMTLADAATLVTARGRLMDALPERGVMVAIQAAESVVAPLLAGAVSLAAVNGPSSVVVSGTREAVAEVIGRLAAAEVAGRLTEDVYRMKSLRVSHAFHSPLMDPMLEEFRAVVEGLTFGEPVIPLVSTVTGALAGDEIRTPGYWVRQVRDTVRFADGITALTVAGAHAVLELGPDGALAALIGANTDDLPAIPLLRKDRGEEPALITALARLFTHGARIDWPQLFTGTSARRIALPTYPFQRRRFWPETAAASAAHHTEPRFWTAAAHHDADAVTALRAQLAAAPEDERTGLLIGVIQDHAAGVLGHADGEVIDPDRAFADLGFDSLTSLELRNLLRRRTGLALPASLLFDYPRPRVLADHLAAMVLSEPDGAAATWAGPVVADEPIAIVGMACRLPGGVRTPEEFWELLAAGRDGITSFPADRGWDLETLSGGGPGSSATARGGFLSGMADFDAGFFGISPREALAMDPQQRLLLEVSWEALERAGIDPVSLRGSRTGVYAGTNGQDYVHLATRAREDLAGHLGTGLAASVLSGRLSYVFGFEGPSTTVDTACSSSLVSLHLAVQALRAGECSLALAGGVTVMTTSVSFAGFSVQGGLAADGRCKSFAEGADGTAWSEGVGVLVVERLSDARRQGHPVLAVVRGSAVNSDGASNGLTAPNGPSQQRVIRAALAGAGLAPGEVDVVEAHGTGTALGDPIEAQALLATYGQGREQPLLLGSAKSNIGHAQAAAGVAGLIKAILAMRHEMVPKTLHVDEPSSQVDWTAGSIELVRENTPWLAGERPRRAGVSSFGISGTNAHVVLEEAPAPGFPSVRESEPGVVPWVVSARSGAALDAALDRLREVDARAVDVGYSLATTRAVFEHRAVLLDGREIARGEAAPGVLAVLFSGQGAQRLGMGRELYDRFPVFAETLDTVLETLEPGLREVMWGDDAEALGRTRYAQPALFAIEVALYRLAESFGLRAGFVAGHSVGEITAAHIAGVFTLPDAAAVISARARLMDALPSGGAMVAIRATEAEVAAVLTDEVAIAAVNAEDSVVVSGTEAAVLAVIGRFPGRRTTRLAVSHAFHSPQMDPVLDEFRAAIDGVSFKEPAIPLISNLTGRLAAPGELTTADYWVRHIRDTVRFADTVRTLHGVATVRLLEIGSDAALSALVPGMVPFLRKNFGEEEAVATALARLHVAGHRVNWPVWYAGTAAAAVELPTYPFRRQRFWPTVSARTADARGFGLEVTGHPLLSASVQVAGTDDVLITGTLSLALHPWLAEHRIDGAAVLPSAVLTELAIWAADRAGNDLVENLTIDEQPIFPEGRSIEVQLRVRDGRELTVHTRLSGDPEAGWIPCAHGTLGSGAGMAAIGMTEWPPADAVKIKEDVYARLAGAGREHGPAFQAVQGMWRRGSEVFAELALPEEDIETRGFGIHPILLDAMAHAAGSLTGDHRSIPVAWTGVALHAGAASTLRVRLTAADGRVAIAAADGRGAPVVSVESVTFASPPEPPEEPAGTAAPLFGVDWVRVPTVPSPGLDWAVLGPDPLGVAEVLAGTGPRLVKSLGELHDAAIPRMLAVPVVGPATPSPAAVRAVTGRVLAILQEFLADEAFARTRVLFVSRGATVVDGAELRDLAGAAVWGLVRSAQSESPGRFLLADIDDVAASAAKLAELPETGEEQLTVRAGTVRAARLSLVPDLPDHEHEPWAPGGTVLITGGTGGIGAELAKHLAATRGVRHLVLASRRGVDSPGTDRLRADLGELGASVTFAACDMGDAASVSALVAGIPATEPLTAVVHAAGVLDDGVLESLDEDRLAAVLRPKVDGAWHLHEATRDLKLGAFVLYSSVAAIMGSPGQANYASANAFLDAFARYRTQLGLPAQTLAWGPWAQDAGMTAGVGSAHLERTARAGVSALTLTAGFALFDQATAKAADHVVVMGTAQRTGPSAGAFANEVPPILRKLAGGRRAAAAEDRSAGLRAELAGLTVPERVRELTTVVRAEAAAVLGHASPDEIGEAHEFAKIGFDSLTAIELRNRLAAVTGVALPSTLVFDHPSPLAAAEHIEGMLGGLAVAKPSLPAELDRFEALLAQETDEKAKAGMAGRLRRILASLDEAAGDTGEVGRRMAAASADELFDFIDRELGTRE